MAVTRQCPTCGHEVDAESDHCQCRERNTDRPNWCQCTVPLLPVRDDPAEVVGPLRSATLRRVANTFRMGAR